MRRQGGGGAGQGGGEPKKIEARGRQGRKGRGRAGREYARWRRGRGKVCRVKTRQRKGIDFSFWMLRGELTFLAYLIIKNMFI